MSFLPTEVRTMLAKSRYYVVFADGSWRTASQDEWKEEQLWKLHPVKTFWCGGEEILTALELVYARYLLESKPTTPEQ